MRTLLALWLVLAAAAGPATTIDDVVDASRQMLRRRSPPVDRAVQVADVPAASWSPAVAAAGTLILLTAVTMAFTALLLEWGVDWRRKTRVRIRWTPLKPASVFAGRSS